ncbi:hypothetical protein OV090_18510 [Nannocystis sp. RBIL2]|uniref:two-component regulator propeller domain-containing protein n=1 Tax=Nannocystis sp. RBIL2 TaxID=2996788 RepID=UPI0022716004|nr:two-component regulator propeller domain-containing protein [Nannocystis sp. RBIL2]MCY1066774.1 hypothetical protein [Nannocystis sp. RBIL2]
MPTPRTKLFVCALPLWMTACDGGPSTPTSETKKTEPPAKVEAKVEAKTETRTETKVEEKAEAKPDDKAAAEPAKPAAAPLTVTAGAPGPAFIAVEKKGIVRLDGGKFTPVSGADTGSYKQLKVGADGKVYAANYSQILRLDAESATVVAGEEPRMPNTASDYAVAADGQIWVAAFSAIDHFDGKAWTSEPVSVLALAADDFPQAIAVDRAGKPWLVTSQKVFAREGDAWQPVDLKPAKARSPYYLTRAALAPDGSVYAMGMDSVFHLVDGQPAKKLKLGGTSSYTEISVSADGHLALIDVDKVTASDPAGKLRALRSGKNFTKGSIWAVAADDSGRVWVGTDAGLAVIGPDGAKNEWPSGAAPEIAGEIKGILVVGSGPAALPGAGEVRKGGLRGAIVDNDGKPVANATLEVCPNPSFIYTKTPCADQAVRFTGKTDAEGVWTFVEVPLGEYGVAVKVGSKWQTTLGFAMNGAMKEGEVFDIGSIKLAEKK